MPPLEGRWTSILAATLVHARTALCIQTRMFEAFVIAAVFTLLTLLLTGTAMWSSGGMGGKDRTPGETKKKR